MNDKIRSLIVDIRRKKNEWRLILTRQQERMLKMTERNQHLTGELLQAKARVATLETQLNAVKDEKNKLHAINEVLKEQQNYEQSSSNDREIITKKNTMDSYIEHINALLQETNDYIRQIKSETI